VGALQSERVLFSVADAPEPLAAGDMVTFAPLAADDGLRVTLTRLQCNADVVATRVLRFPSSTFAAADCFVCVTVSGASAVAPPNNDTPADGLAGTGLSGRGGAGLASQPSRPLSASAVTVRSAASTAAAATGRSVPFTRTQLPRPIVHVRSQATL
jgi:hypothetical protein